MSLVTRPLLLFMVIFLCLQASAQITNEKNIDYNWKTDLSKSTVDLEEVIAILPRGSLPKLDYPAFVGKKKGMKMFFGKEPVIAVEFDGEAKAYPLTMLTMHEIVNDKVGSVPVLVTYCALCDASMVFDRRVEHEGKENTLEFEVSGLLRWSDMIMYDTETESWWQQLMGEGMVGDFSGAELEWLASSILSVESFFDHYPEGKIMSKDNENGVDYDKVAYDHYDDISGAPHREYFDPEDIDPRLPAMERVVVVNSYQTKKVYPYTRIEEMGAVNDKVDDKPLVIFYSHGVVSILDEFEIEKSKDIGTAIIYDPVVDETTLTFRKQGDFFVDDQTGSKWDLTGECKEGKLKGSQLKVQVHGHHFAFAFLAFNPEAVVYN